MGRGIVVLGMHRSGTSAVAGLMEILGASVGPGDLLGTPNSENPKGYFEYNHFVHVNETLLGRADAAWDRIPTSPPDWAEDSKFQDLKPFVAQCIQEHFSETEIWAVKDPRFCITFPFWRSALPGPIDVVLVFRHPIEVADSLASRDGMPRERSVTLWEAYVKASIFHSQGLRRHVMFYEDLVEDLDAETDRLAGFMDVPKPGQYVRKAILGFVEKEFRHHRRNLTDLSRQTDLPASVGTLFRALRAHVDLARKGNVSDSDLDLALENPREESVLHS